LPPFLSCKINQWVALQFDDLNSSYNIMSGVESHDDDFDI